MKKKLSDLSEEFHAQELLLKEGGGASGQERQRKLGRLTARERIHLLADHSEEQVELGLWAGYKMYTEWGEFPAAGVVTTIANVSGRACMIIANDATVKAGAMFPQSVKKVLRAQRIAFECRLPTIYLVDSAGVFLPLQEEIFPDEDDFGRIFRNNAVFSSAGIPQFAAIMGNCIAGGGYLPVLCDHLLMTEGSGLYLAGPALVKEAIGQVVDTETLGGAKMHASISGTVDYLEKDDPSCLKKLKKLIDFLPPSASLVEESHQCDPIKHPSHLYDIVGADCNKAYDIHVLLDCIVDRHSFQEYKADFGKTLVTGFARINGNPVGIVANQRIPTKTEAGEIQIGGVIYSDSAAKAARFVMNCNQESIPILFFQDVMGFMVGKQAEESGIIRHGAQLVNAISNSIVPKITLVIGNSFGAGNYALCGKAYDPNFIIAWPNAKFAVMGADQASGTLYSILSRQRPAEDAEKIRQEVHRQYTEKMDIRYGAARGWVDMLIAPHRTRWLLIQLTELLKQAPLRSQSFHTGVIQL